jgi:hypothetical protein
LRSRVCWYVNGQRHRTDIDPATGLTLPAEISHDGEEIIWFVNGKAHRNDKDPATGLSMPAVVNASIDSSSWYINGMCHRGDGPAERTIGESPEYYWNDEEVTREEVIKRASAIPWAIWVNQAAPQQRRLPNVVFDEVVEFATPQMAEEETVYEGRPASLPELVAWDGD